jgi:hypothetical protein
MNETPRWAKAHSKRVADEYLALGWRLASVFQGEGCGEPYEWLLEWVGPGPAVSPSAIPARDEPLPPGAIPCTDLEYWASLGNLQRVAEALAANPDVNIRGVGGYTAMHAAAENGHQGVIRFLAARGADLSPRLDSGETPLALAELAGQHEAAALLRSLGAIMA